MENVFLLGSGASHHMVWNKEWLRNSRQIRPPKIILLGDGKNVILTHRGTLVLSTRVEVGGESINRYEVFDHVLSVPELHSNPTYCANLFENYYVINVGLNVCNRMH